MLKSIFKNSFLHFFPLTCSACKLNSISSPDKFCENCLSKLNFIEEPFCKSCGGINNTIFDICSNCMNEEKCNWDFALSVFEMKSLARDLIIKYKYYKETPLVRPFAKFCIDKLNSAALEFDVITYIPLHWTKYLKRGFNQSCIIANYISLFKLKPSKKLLKRTRFTKSQTRLSTKKRRKNIVGAFKAVNLKFIENKKILIIDDVFTTGSTLREAAKKLREAKAEKVFILTLARR